MGINICLDTGHVCKEKKCCYGWKQCCLLQKNEEKCTDPYTRYTMIERVNRSMTARPWLMYK